MRKKGNSRKVLNFSMDSMTRNVDVIDSEFWPKGGTTR
jgi:hypothetical protein